VEDTCTDLMSVRIRLKINNDKKNKGGGSREGGGTFMFNKNYQSIENEC
jgi:hypothetical protein